MTNYWCCKAEFGEHEDDCPNKNLFGMCGRCYDDDLPLFTANCAEKPEALVGAPLGQYHCPDCGAMVVAGLPHPPMCRVCIERKHPGFDMPNAKVEDSK